MRYDAHPPLGHPEVAGWVLGALDRSDSGAFGEHLRSCSRCQATVAEFESVAAALGRPVPADEPPAGLEARVLAAVQRMAPDPSAEAAEMPSAQQTWQAVEGWQVVPGEHTGELPRVEEVPRAGHAVPQEKKIAARRPRRLNNWLLVAAMSAAVAIAVGITLLGRAVFRTTPPAVTATASLRAPAGATGSGTATAHPATAAGGWSVQLTVTGLRKLPAGRYYECWYVAPGGREPISAGTFTVDGGGSQAFTMWTAADPRRSTTVEITVQGPASAGQQSAGPPGPVALKGTVRNG